jgi:hypothetical protein
MWIILMIVRLTLLASGRKFYDPTTKEAYEKVLPLPEMDEAAAALKTSRAMLIIYGNRSEVLSGYTAFHFPNPFHEGSHPALCG